MVHERPMFSKRTGRSSARITSKRTSQVRVPMSVIAATWFRQRPGDAASRARCVNTPKKSQESLGTRLCSSTSWRPAMKGHYGSGASSVSLPLAGYSRRFIILPGDMLMRWSCTSGCKRNHRFQSMSLPSGLRPWGGLRLKRNFGPMIYQDEHDLRTERNRE